MNTKLLMMVAVMLLSFTSCKVDFNGASEKIEASKNIVRAKYPQASFDKVDIHVVGHIRLVQSQEGKSRVTLSAPDNYIDYFVFNNKDGELEIKFTKDAKNLNLDTENIDIIIYTPTLKKITNAGAADIRMDSLTTDEIDIKNSGVGAFNIAKINAKEVEVSCSGVGSIEVSGQTDEAEYDCSGVGGISAKDLKARNVEASVSGVGGIDCFASEYIKGNVSGVGGLKYGGHPAKKELHHSMTGGISEL